VPGSESSTWIRTFPDWSESSGHRIRMTCDAHDGGDSSRKTTTRPKSGLKIKICLKIKVFPPQVHTESGSAHRGSGLGSGPKSGSGLNKMASVREGGSVFSRWIRPGLLYHCSTTSGPGLNLRWDRSGSAAIG
jgi:hypothetical protein